MIAHTSLDVDAIRADKDDLLVVGGSHVVMNVDGIAGWWCGVLRRGRPWSWWSEVERELS